MEERKNHQKVAVCYYKLGGEVLKQFLDNLKVVKRLIQCLKVRAAIKAALDFIL
jgi:hypothetical protein